MLYDIIAVKYKKGDFMGFFDVINICGLIFTVIMIIPHIIFVKTHNVSTSFIENRAMLYIERIGKYCGAFLMAVNIGVLEKGFTSLLMRDFWFITTIILIIVYLIMWTVFLKTEKKIFAYIITVITAIILMLSGLLQVKTLLLTAGIVYFIGELYVLNKLD